MFRHTHVPFCQGAGFATGARLSGKVAKTHKKPASDDAVTSYGIRKIHAYSISQICRKDKYTVRKTKVE
jgi:hypothetical protein